MAHGKRLSKQQLLNIELVEICQQVLSPDVPHSLRLQGILIGGIALVFAKQQIYFWEDLQDMIKSVKDAAEYTVAGQKPPAATLKHVHARMEDITMPEDDLLNAIGGLGQDDFLSFDGQYDLGNSDEFSDLLQAPTLSSLDPKGRSGTAAQSLNQSQGDYLHDDHFCVDVAKLNSGGGMVQGNMMNSQGTSNVGGRLLMGPGLSTHTPAFQQNLFSVGGGAAQDEMFDPIGDDMLDIIEQLNPMPVSRKMEASKDNGKQALPEDGDSVPMSEDHSVSFASGGKGGDRSPADQFNDATGGAEDAVEGEGHAQAAQNRGHRPALPPTKAKVKRNRCGAQPVVDSIESITIRTSTYREWLSDTSEIVRAHSRRTALLASPSDAAQQLFNMQAMDDSQDGQHVHKNVLPLLCSELEHLRGLAFSAGAGGAGPDDEPPSKQAKRARQDTHDAGLARSRQSRRVPHLYDVPGINGVDFGEPLVEEYAGADEYAAADHAQAQAGYGSDVELERLRAGSATPGGSAAAAAARARLQGLASTGGMSMDASGQYCGSHLSGSSAGTGSSDAAVLGMLGSGGIGIAGVMPMAKYAARRAGSASVGALSPIDDVGYGHDDGQDPGQEPGALLFGNGALEDLLPAIKEDTEPKTAAAGSGSLKLSAALRSSGRQGSTMPSLLETSYKDTQMPMFNKTTKTVLGIFRKRFEEVHAACPVTVGSGQCQTKPQVSFFELASGLRRSEAVKLFYQVMVTHTTTYIVATQEKAFGDILISAGPHLPDPLL